MTNEHSLFLFGIELSDRTKGYVDFSSINQKKGGLDFITLRASAGTSFQDSSFIDRWGAVMNPPQEAKKKKDYYVGAYHSFSWKSHPKTQALNFITQIKQATEAKTLVGFNLERNFCRLDIPPIRLTTANSVQFRQLLKPCLQNALLVFLDTFHKKSPPILNITQPPRIFIRTPLLLWNSFWSDEDVAEAETLFKNPLWYASKEQVPFPPYPITELPRGWETWSVWETPDKRYWEGLPRQGPLTFSSMLKDVMKNQKGDIS